MARAEVPPAVLERLDRLLADFAEVRREAAWTGVRWQIGGSTFAHVFGGEDQLIRLTFHAEPDEAMAFAHLGRPYFAVGWSRQVVGIEVDERTDWVEVRELLTDSYCLQAPRRLADEVDRPG